MTEQDLPPVLDELVPPAWSTPQRLLVASALLAATVIAGLVWWSGALVPKLAVEPAMSGHFQPGELDDARVMDTHVTINVPIENRGRFTAKVTGWEPPATSGIAWEDHSPRQPIRLEPGDQIEIMLAGTIEDCLAVDAHGADGLDVTAQGAMSLSWSQTLPVSDFRGAADWLNVDHGRGHIDGSPREPSWLYDALGWACDPAAHERS